MAEHRRLRVESLTMSLDGYVAGPDQSADDPLGIGGERLHEWAWRTRTVRRIHGMEGGDTGVDDAWAARSDIDVGATIMGRNMFGPVRGPWPDDPWRGWWGDDPPFHHPVFVLTHYTREPLEMEGGTTFHFVTEGIEAALEMASVAAGARDVRLGGGAETVRQYLRAGLVDEMHLVTVPLLLGGGALLLEGLGAELVDRYRVAETVVGESATHWLIVRAGA